jgi:methyl-accepting chemotaxis protein
MGRIARMAAWRWPLTALSLQARLCLAALGLLVLSLGVTAAVIGVRAGAQAEADTMALARSASRGAAGALESAIRGHLGAVAQLAAVARLTHEAGRPPTRDQLDDMARGLLAEQPDLLSAGFIWEPDALDGRDAAWAGKAPRFDASGQYKVLWMRGAQGGYAAMPVQMDTPGSADWYELPRRTGKPVFMEPYAYPMDGKEVLAASLVSPIVVDGRFRGAVFADFSLAQLGRLLAALPSMPGTGMALVSNGGLYAAHDDAHQLRQPARDIPVEGLKAVKAGLPYEYEDDARVHLLQPLRVHPDMPPWAVRVSFPKALATQAARTLVRDTLLAALACAALATLVLLWVLHRLLLPLRELSQVMGGLSQGEADLGVQLDARGHDELARIAGGFNGFVRKVNRSLWHIRESSSSMLLAASEIATGNNDLSTRTESAASSLQRTAASMESLSRHVGHTARAADQVNQLAESASAVAAQGGELVQRVVDTMSDIHRNSRRVADITGVIDGIAFQTNVLAINASVEAARAGERGRGFGVVAGEVRLLAQRCAEAAREIKALVQASVEQVDQGAVLAQRTGQTMRDVVNAVQTLTTLIGDIRHATGDQSRSLQDIHAAVALLDAATQQNAALVEQGLAAAESLREQSAALAQVAAGFRLGFAQG